MSYTEGQQVLVTLHSVKDEPGTVIADKSATLGYIEVNLTDEVKHNDIAFPVGSPLWVVPGELRPA